MKMNTQHIKICETQLKQCWENFIALTYIRNEERFQIKNLRVNLKKLEK